MSHGAEIDGSTWADGTVPCCAPIPILGGSGDPIPILLALGTTLDPSCVAAV